MFVYVWKHNDTPFYVGLSKSIRRTNPLNTGNRGWLCTQTLERIGPKNVVVELHTVDTVDEAKQLERSLIEKYGRVQLGNGPLTNLRPGGEGAGGMTVEGRKATSERMRLANPMHNPKTRAKATARMNDPDVLAKFTGDANPAKRPEVRAKLKAKWEDPEYREARRVEKLGKAIHTEEHKEALRAKLLEPANPLREYHKTLNSDPSIKAKRKFALQNPEVRARISASLKAKWAERKASL